MYVGGFDGGRSRLWTGNGRERELMYHAVMFKKACVAASLKRARSTASRAWMSGGDVVGEGVELGVADLGGRLGERDFRRRKASEARWLAVRARHFDYRRRRPHIVRRR